MHGLQACLFKYITIAAFCIYLSVVRMLLKGEVGGHALKNHGNYIFDRGKIMELCFWISVGTLKPGGGLNNASLRLYKQSFSGEHSRALLFYFHSITHMSYHMFLMYQMHETLQSALFYPGQSCAGCSFVVLKFTHMVVKWHHWFVNMYCISAYSGTCWSLF